MLAFASRCLAGLLICFALTWSIAARAQWAVIDAPAIVQLVQEVQTMQQQLQTARNQLQQARDALQSMTGDRGFAQLLATIPRNYLPTDALQLLSISQGSASAFPTLSADVRAAIERNAVLSADRLTTLSVDGQQQIAAVRQAAALQQSLSQVALANASSRFVSIQSLIASIPTATDQKGILDLQARISAELGMLQNEQTKLLVLNQATEAQAAVIRQQGRERIIAADGRFESRFRPLP